MKIETAADLHMHTNASDGTSTVEERIDQAIDKGLNAIAITDHDTVNSDLHGRVREEETLEIISGVEIKTEANGNRIEILGYFVEPENRELEELLNEIRSRRRKRNERIAENIEEKTSVDIDLEKLRSKTDGFVARPHFAEKLIEQGQVEDISEAFSKHLSTKGDCHSPMERVSAGKVISTIHEAKGLASLAHPGRAKTNDIRELVSELEDQGLDALEVYYPYQEDPPERYAGTTVEEASELAEKYNLLKTGGSDCHGPDSGKFRIGEEGISAQKLLKLKKKASIS